MTTASITWDDIADQVAQLLCFGDTYALSTGTRHKDKIDDFVRMGALQFYNPPPLPGESSNHEWSFLKPTGIIVTDAKYSTGTIDFDFDDTTDFEVTLTTGTWPSWAAQGEITFGGSTYNVVTRTSDSIIVLGSGDNPGADVAALTTYSLAHVDYTLPAGFAGIEGDMTFRSSDNRHSPVRVVPEVEIRRLRQSASGDTSGTPYAVAIRPVQNSATEVQWPHTISEQTWEAMLFRAPDAQYVLEYQYNTTVDLMVFTSSKYPFGGQYHGLTMLYSCLAVAERALSPRDRLFDYQSQWMNRLAASVAFDRKSQSAEHYGQNLDRSDQRYSRRFDEGRRVTVSGVLY